MNFVKLLLDINYGNYSYGGASHAEIGILGIFFSSDIGCAKIGSPTYAEWTFQDKWGTSFCGNAICVEREGDFVFLSDVFPDEEAPLMQLKMTRQQFVDIIDEWYKKVCKYKPKEVTIKYDNGQFSIETKD
jgi:hypothetical protein